MLKRLRNSNRIWVVDAYFALLNLNRTFLKGNRYEGTRRKVVVVSVVELGSIQDKPGLMWPRIKRKIIKGSAFDPSKPEGCNKLTVYVQTWAIITISSIC